MTRISVAVAVRDVEAYVAEALDSVLPQLGPDDEVVVVDDGSTDGTPDVLAAYGDRIRVLSPGTVGLGAARNLSIRESRGRYLAFIDGDDRWVPGSLATLLAALEARPDADVVHGHITEFVDPGVDLRAAHLRDPVADGGGVFLGALLARREVFDRATFSADQPLAITTDWVARARAAGIRFVPLDDVLLERRLRPDSMTADAEGYQQALLGALRANLRLSRGGEA